MNNFFLKKIMNRIFLCKIYIVVNGNIVDRKMVICCCRNILFMLWCDNDIVFYIVVIFMIFELRFFCN